ncbi:MAG: lipopolysaccharide biosynthesis protein [Candidatus Omnitrophica bacterium]|nr:lipopolysaccharide biosynthesis protein [Candidatus Omnitrophota bacterium]
MIDAENLRSKTIRNLFVVYSFKVLWMGINFVRSIIIARLLFPEDFAIIALAYSFIYLIEQMFTFGFSKVLIHKKTLSSDELNTAFTLNCIQNVLFYGIMYLGAPFVARFYGNADLILVIRLLGIELLLQILGFIPRVMLQKSLQFKIVESVTFFTSLLSTIITVGCAFLGLSFWSIIIGTLVGKFTQSIVYLYYSKLEARLYLVKSIVKQYFKFGIVIYVTAIVTYLNSSLDTMMIGKISGMVVLGYYAVARQWGRYFLDNLFVYITQVLFPTYAQIQDNIGRMSLAFTKTIKYTIPVIMPFFVGFYLIAPDFVRVLLGAKWLPVIVPLRVMLIAMLFDSLGQMFGPVSDAVGKFQIKLKLSVITLLLMATIFPVLGVMKGLNGFCLAICIVKGIGLIYAYKEICIKILNIKFSSLVLLIRSPLISTLSMIIAICLFQFFLCKYIVSDYSQLFLVIITGVITYLTTLLVIDNKIFIDVKDIVLESIRKK